VCARAEKGYEAVLVLVSEVEEWEEGAGGKMKR